MSEGYFARRKARKMAERAEAEAAAKRQKERELNEAREAERVRIKNQLDIARDPAGAYDEREGCPIIPKRHEEVIGIVSDTGLVEVKAGRVEYRGGSSGVSFRVAKGVTLRTGAHKGTAYREPEMPRVLCAGGTLVITNQRAVYVGPKYTREFVWAKLLAFTEGYGEGGTSLLMPVENRQKTSGVLVGGSYDYVVARCEMGVAAQRGTLPQLIAELEEELEALQ
ncbi:MAG: hypothetical protein OXB92_12800 [Acidimicrobiaceae bacterium]|nr:hypothetical protein [Acidimicrobiaceae bacterium]